MTGDSPFLGGSGKDDRGRGVRQHHLITDAGYNGSSESSERRCDEDNPGWDRFMAAQALIFDLDATLVVDEPSAIEAFSGI